jgi:hypothetical protein
MTRKKIRRLELLPGAPPKEGPQGLAGGKSKAVFDAERELSGEAAAALEPTSRHLTFIRW